MGMEEVVIFAWLPCTWVDEFGMLAGALEGAWGEAIYGVLEMRQRGSGSDMNQSKRDAPMILWNLVAAPFINRRVTNQFLQVPTLQCGVQLFL